jgi:hypothetical protein
MSFRGALSAVFAVAVLHAPLAAQDLSGTWHIDGDSHNGSIHQTLVLTQDATVLTGTVAETPDDPDDQPVAVQISDGTVLGKEFTFVITLDFGNNVEQRLYAGTFEGDSLQGTLRNFTGPSVPFRGRRGG